MIQSIGRDSWGAAATLTLLSVRGWRKDPSGRRMGVRFVVKNL